MDRQLRQQRAQLRKKTIENQQCSKVCSAGFLYQESAAEENEIAEVPHRVVYSVILHVVSSGFHDRKLVTDRIDIIQVDRGNLDSLFFIHVIQDISPWMYGDGMTP